MMIAVGDHMLMIGCVIDGDYRTATEQSDVKPGADDTTDTIPDQTTPEIRPYR